MSKLATLAAVLPFAHLLGVRAAKDDADESEKKAKAKKAKAAEDEDGEEQEDRDSPAKNDDNDGKKKSKAEDHPMGDDDDKDDSTKGKKAKAAEDESTEDDDDVEKKKTKKAKGARAEDDDDEGDANAKRAEKKRCAAILAEAIRLGSMGSVIQACSLAFDTDMPVEAATRTLVAVAGATGVEAPKTGAQRLQERMDSFKAPNVGPAAEQVDASSPQAIAQQILAAASKARPVNS